MHVLCELALENWMLQDVSLERREQTSLFEVQVQAIVLVIAPQW